MNSGSTNNKGDIMEIIKGDTIEHNKIWNEALDYVLDVTKKQGQFLPFELLYGDGSRWKPLSRQGFRLIYDSVKETLTEQGYKI
jgi:hypothetical protein